MTADLTHLMTMADVSLAQLIWLASALLAIYPLSLLAAKTLREENYGELDHTDRGSTIFFGVVASPFWPLILGGYIAYWVSKKICTFVRLLAHELWEATRDRDHQATR